MYSTVDFFSFSYSFSLSLSFTKASQRFSGWTVNDQVMEYFAHLVKLPWMQLDSNRYKSGYLSHLFTKGLPKKNNFHWMCTLIMSRVVGSLLLLHGKVRMSYCIRWERVCIGLHYIPDQQEAIEISHNTSRLKVVYSHSLIINPSLGMYQETHPKRPIGKGLLWLQRG